MDISKKIGFYMKNKKYKLAEVARRTGLNYRSLYAALYGRESRELKASELLKVCAFLNIDPREFSGGEDGDYGRQRKFGQDVAAR